MLPDRSLEMLLPPYSCPASVPQGQDLPSIASEDLVLSLLVLRERFSELCSPLPSRPWTGHSLDRASIGGQ